MSDIDTVLERLVTDAAFRGQLGSDPAAALAGYDLSADDLQLLASSLDDGDAGQRGVEQRTSKSAVLGLLASFAGGGGGGDQASALDAGSKDAARFDDLAPPDDGAEDASRHKLPGRPKPGELTLTRLAEPGGGGGGGGGVQAPLDDVAGGDAPAVEFKQGFPIKWEGPSLSAADGTDLDPNLAPGDVPGDDAAAARFKQGFPIKWQGAGIAEDGTDLDPDVAPADDAGTDDMTKAWPKKIEIGSMKAGDTSAAGKAMLPDLHRPAEPPPDDFLTIEDA